MQHEACHPTTPSTPDVEPTKKEYDTYFQRVMTPYAQLPSTPPPITELCPSPPSKHNRRYTPVKDLPTEKQNKVRELWRQKNAQRRAEMDELRRKADRTIRIQKVEKSLSQLVQMVRGNELLLKDLMQRIQKVDPLQ